MKLKFNNQLLEDDENKTLIKDGLENILEYYKDVESKQLLWELIKMEIRSKTIIYSKRFSGRKFASTNI